MDNYQNNPGVPPINPDQTQTAGQPYGQPYGQQQSYQQYQQQGFPNFTGQGNNGALVVTDYARQHLKSIAGWTKFLSIVMLIMLIFGILACILGMVNTSSLMPSRAYDYGYGYDYRGVSEIALRIVFVIYLVIIALFILPTIWSLSSASKLKKAALNGDSQDLEGGLRLWKYVCTFFGVLTIIYLVFLVLAIVSAVATA